MATDWETRYYEQQANFTESNGMLSAEVRHREGMLREALRYVENDGLAWTPERTSLAERIKRAIDA